jgi:hypothetical protein
MPDYSKGYSHQEKSKICRNQELDEASDEAVKCSIYVSSFSDDDRIHEDF